MSRESQAGRRRLFFRGIDLLVQDIDGIDDAGDDGVDRQRLHAGRLPGGTALAEQHDLVHAGAEGVDGHDGVGARDGTARDWLRRRAGAAGAAVCGLSSPRLSSWRRPGR